MHLEKLEIANFKGIRKFSQKFGQQTDISGDNATGKTTIKDAFIWLLFGKDSTDREKFNIKTLDESGEPIHNLEHKVEATINGIKYGRIYREKWETKRGDKTERFTGHETVFEINDVKKSKSEFTGAVAELCAEDVFKMITSPIYFNEKMGWQLQREILFRYAGEIDTGQPAKKFEALLARMQGRNVDIYQEEIKKQIKKIGEQLKEIPIRIDEQNSAIPQAENWLELEAEINSKEAQIKNLDKQVRDISEANEVRQQARVKLQNELYQLEDKLRQQERDGSGAHSDKKTELETKIRTFKSRRETISSELAEARAEANSLTNKISDKREEWKEESAKTITFTDDGSELICPTCKRMFKGADLEEKKAKLTKQHNIIKAEMLKEITEQGERLAARLKEMKEKINSLTADNVATGSVLEEAEKELAKLEKSAPKVEQDKEALSRVKAIKEELEKTHDGQATDSLLEQEKEQVVKELDSLKSRYAKKEVIEEKQFRIKELGDKQRKLAQEKAKLEKEDMMIDDLIEEKSKKTEAVVNKMFEIVKFKLFDKQVNGQIVPTCKATVNGVPYTDLNTAAKINAGLDIINFLIKNIQVAAPIFIDNRESITETLPVDTQVINLYKVGGMKALEVKSK